MGNTIKCGRGHGFESRCGDARSLGATLARPRAIPHTSEVRGRHELLENRLAAGLRSLKAATMVRIHPLQL